MKTVSQPLITRPGPCGAGVACAHVCVSHGPAIALTDAPIAEASAIWYPMVKATLAGGSPPGKGAAAKYAVLKAAVVADKVVNAAVTAAVAPGIFDAASTCAATFNIVALIFSAFGSTTGGAKASAGVGLTSMMAFVSFEASSSPSPAPAGMARQAFMFPIMTSGDPAPCKGTL